MPSDQSNDELLQCFRRKLQAALQLTQDDYRREAKHGGDRADVLARLKPHVQANFKPVARIASQLIAAGFAWEVEEVHGTTGWVISDLRANPYPVDVLHEYEFQDMFTDVWCRLVLEAEREAPSQAGTQSQTVPGDARSRALASESKSAADEEESGEDRRRREVIHAAVKVGKEGLAYCEFLDLEQIHPSPRLQAKGCPDTYVAAYKFKQNGAYPWRKPIQDEKTRLSRGLSSSTTSSETIVNEPTKNSIKKSTVH